MNYYKLPIFFVILSLMMTVLVRFSHAQQSHTIVLAGYKSVPKIQTSATSSIDVTLNEDSLSIEGSFENLSSYYYGSAIFYGKKDEQGNKIISLKPTIEDNRMNGTFEKSKNTFKLTEGQLEALAQGSLYISILSFDHRRGELRAQLPAFQIK